MIRATAEDEGVEKNTDAEMLVDPSDGQEIVQLPLSETDHDEAAEDAGAATAVEEKLPSLFAGLNGVSGATLPTSSPSDSGDGTLHAAVPVSQTGLYADPSSPIARRFMAYDDESQTGEGVSQPERYPLDDEEISAVASLAQLVRQRISSCTAIGRDRSARA